MLALHLRPIFALRHIDRPFNFLVKAGISRNIASRLVSSDTGSLRIKDIETLCTLLVCEPSDLFYWRPDKTKLYAQDHPLYKLQRNESSATINDMLSSAPLQQLREMAKGLEKGEDLKG
jgi:DNA-binding Xre family transcriptional regulator